jgi:hypothetical protein
MQRETELAQVGSGIKICGFHHINVDRQRVSVDTAIRPRFEMEISHLIAGSTISLWEVNSASK